MKALSVALVLLTLAGCYNTWNGVREDGSRIIGRSVSGIGHGIGKAGQALERTGSRIDNSQQVQQPQMYEQNQYPYPAQNQYPYPAQNQYPEQNQYQY
ncbi:pyrrolo-quinoline quinone [Neisseria sp. CP9]|jgi:conserved domain protein|uniref:pyrrolo-quinoline quinone n=1 Tax=Neisseria sp. CP9 TaxID=3388843 RepID=UPI0039EE5C35